MNRAGSEFACQATSYASPVTEGRTTRDEQREQTKQRIVAAAVGAFAERGFDGTSTRAIADRAGVTQGLVTYHFESKDELWRAAVDSIIAELDAALPTRDTDAARGPRGDRRGARLAIRAYVSFAARHPELFQIMVDAGRHDDERMRWIVERHLRTRFAEVAQLAGGHASPDAAHLYYALIGASSLIGAVAPECHALTGVDPRTEAAISRHADIVADLFVP